ncbi:MAG: hypothetical protein HC877_14530 [Thioploca sp.]|nr:hypothetical protein [Thioploca sp.]
MLGQGLQTLTRELPNTVLKHNTTVLISLTGDSWFDIGGLVFTNILLQSPFFQPVISFFCFGEGIVKLEGNINCWFPQFLA